MRINLSLFFCIASFSTLFAQKTIKGIIQNEWERIGSWAQINDTLFCSGDEITIGEFSTYLYSKYAHKLYEHLDSVQVEKFGNDSVKIKYLLYGSYVKDKLFNDVKFIKKSVIIKDVYNLFYHTPYLIDSACTESVRKDNGLKEKPMSLVAYEDAVDYCSYIERMIKISLRNDSNKIQITCRLPTKKEWEAIAWSKSDSTLYPYNFKIDLNKPIDFCQPLGNSPKKCYEYYELPTGNWKGDVWGIYTFPVYLKQMIVSKDYFMGRLVFPEKFSNRPYASNWKRGTKAANSLIHENDLTHICGNLSEMVLEKGIAKGGSWIHPFEECKISSTHTYDKPYSWVGFRPILIVKSKE